MRGRRFTAFYVREKVESDIMQSPLSLSSLKPKTLNLNPSESQDQVKLGTFASARVLQGVKGVL